MNANISLSSFTRTASNVLAHHHITIYTVVTAMLLSAAIGVLYLIVFTPGDTDETVLNQARISGTFDSETIKRVNELRDSSDADKPVVFPSPRSNPFVE